MGYIGNEPTTGHFPVDNFTSSGGSTYTLAKAPASAGAIEVSVQGVLQPTTAYTVSGTTLNMAGVTTGVKIFVRHLGETLTLPTIADGVVTTAKLGVNSVDGTKIAMGSDARGDILYHGATDYARLAKGTSGQVLTMGANDPAWATAAAGGKVLQVVHTESGAVLTHTTVMPSDDSLNTSSEGGELFTLAITPANVSNKLIIQSVVHYSHSASNTFCTANLYQDSTANTISTIGTNMQRTGTDMTSMVGWHYMTAGTTSATTFKVRAGGNNGGTYTLNGMSGNRYGGGTHLSGMTIWEIAV
jgi:hypothetical protein